MKILILFLFLFMSFILKAQSVNSFKPRITSAPVIKAPVVTPSLQDYNPATERYTPEQLQMRDMMKNYNHKEGRFLTDEERKNRDMFSKYKIEGTFKLEVSKEVERDIEGENKKVREAFKKSATRAAFGYALAALGATVTGLAAVEVKKIKARIAKIKELKEALDPVAGGLVCANQDYENKSKLGCYCMTADGTPNQSRDPKGVCSAYLGNGKLAPKGRNYNLGQVASTNNSAGCMTQSYIYDPSCYCKKSGSCMKISTGANNIGGLSSLVGQMVGGANDIFKGNTGSGNFNAGTYINGAARLSKLKDKILAAPKYQDLGNQIKKMEDYYIKSEQQRAGGTGSQSYDAVNPVAQALSGVLPDSAKKAMDSLYAEEKKNKYQGFSGAGKVAGKDDPFDFSLPGGNQALNDTEVLSMMDQNYAYDKADIAAPSSASLFDILSLRYQKSAQGRLFAK